MTLLGRCATAAVLAAAMVGCGQSPPVVCSVKGKVSVNGKPAGGVYLQFRSLEDKELAKRPDGCKSEIDGRFELKVHGKGQFAVTTFWPTLKIEQGEEIEGADRFNGEFQVAESPLLKVQLTDGANTIPPIDIKPKKLTK